MGRSTELVLSQVAGEIPTAGGVEKSIARLLILLHPVLQLTVPVEQESVRRVIVDHRVIVFCDFQFKTAAGSGIVSKIKPIFPIARY